MNYQADPSNSDWKANKIQADPAEIIKQEHLITINNKPKYSQKFCEKWLNIFSPWLARCEDDPNKPFCRACQSRLDCNRCHLQRHERTAKHARNLEILINKGESAAKQNLSIRQERSKYYQQRKKLNESPNEDSDLGLDVSDDFIDDTDAEHDSSFRYEQTDVNSNQEFPEEEFVSKQQQSIPVESTHRVITRLKTKNCIKRTQKLAAEEVGDNVGVPIRKEGIKLLMQIQKDKIELMDSFKELIGDSLVQQPPQKQKNHVDLFFESVSSSVKALSPKLIAETKMRVSQLICELELRALTEDDANNSNPHSLDANIIDIGTHHSDSHFSSTHYNQLHDGHNFKELS